MSNTSLLLQARELQEFFIGTYADKALEAAIRTDNEDVLSLTVSHFASQQELIERQESAG